MEPRGSLGSYDNYMTKNPLVNAGAALLYIIAVVNLIGLMEGAPDEDTLIIPMAMVSLLTLSAAIMGYLFIFEPLKMVLAGDHQRGVTLFLQTIAIFAVITAGLFTIVYFGVFA